MKYGYIRVSTISQKDNTSLEHQKEVLEKYNCDMIFSDICSGGTINRPQFAQLFNILKSGDYLYVMKIDRLFRNIQEGLSVIKELKNKGITIHIDNLGTLDDSITGNLLVNILLSFSEWERETIKERMFEGKISSGNFGGRPNLPKSKIDLIYHLLDSKHTIRQIERETGLSKTTIMKYKKIRERKE